MMTIIAFLFLVSSLGTGAASLFGLNHLNENITNSKDKIVEPLLTLRKFDEIVVDIPYRMLLFVSDQYPAVGTVNKLNESNKNLINEWAKFKRLYPADEAELKVISAIDSALSDLPEFNESLYKALNAEDTELVAELFEDEWPDFQIELTNNSAQLVTFLEKKLSESSQKAANFNAAQILNISILCGISLVLGLCLLWCQRKIKRSLKSHSTELDKIASNFITSVQDSKVSATKLASTGDEQLSSIKESYELLDQVSKKIIDTKEGVEISKHSSESISSKIEIGSERVGELNSKMNLLSGRMSSLFSGVEKIDSSTRNELQNISDMINEISSKTKLIDGIVRQTKLLSFNASVEAARAGEHGKGFAVVAEEVAQLSSATGVTSAEISSLITKATNNVESMTSDILSVVEKAKDDAKQSKGVFEDVNEACKSAAEIFGEISGETEKIEKNIATIFEDASNQESQIKKVSSSMESLANFSEESKKEFTNNIDSADNLKVRTSKLIQLKEEIVEIVDGNADKKAG